LKTSGEGGKRVVVVEKKRWWTIGGGKRTLMPLDGGNGQCWWKMDELSVENR
jgi:hypothetical protein